MAYGEIKVDTITFTDGGIDKSVAISGLVQNPTVSGNITVTGTISGNTVRGQTISGVTVTGTTAQFTSGTFTSITGGTATITSGVFAAGSAASPSISFTSDPNTGLYSPGADQLALSTNGTGRLFVDASGNVLINDSQSVTSNVSAYLRIRQVNAAADTSIAIINAQNSDANATVKIQAGQFTRRGGEIVFGRENGGDWSSTTSADGYISFSPVLDNSNTERLRITSAGLVGIGTSSPSNNIEVVGSAVADTDTNYAYFRGPGGTEPGVYIGGNSTTSAPSATARYGYIRSQSSAGAARALYLQTGTNTRLVIDNTGNVGVGTTSPGALVHFSKGSAGETLRLQGDSANVRYLSFTSSDVGIFTGAAWDRNINSSAGTHTWSINGTERARITSAGLVGIGTSSPATRLHVEGTNNAECVRFDGNSGAENRNLIFSNANNSLRWILNSEGAGTSGELWFQTNSTTRLAIGATGNVGIGTTSPIALFNTQQASGGAEAPVLFQNVSTSPGTSVALYLSPSSGSLTTGSIRAAAIKGIADSSNIVNLAFFTNSSGADPVERARIDSSGRLLVGTSSALTFKAGSTFATAVQPSAQFVASGSNAGTAFLRTDAFPHNIYLAAGSSGNAVVDGSTLGQIVGQGFSTADSGYLAAGLIKIEVDGEPDTSGDTTDMPGRLVFATTADGAASPTERMRIDSDGTLLLGVNTKVIGRTTNPYLFFQAQSNVATAGMSIESYGNNIALRYHFAFTNPNGVVGTISTNGTATAYNTSSDYRLKENVTAVTDGITRLQQLKPSRFNFIADPTKTVDGFLAHEVQAVVPEAITGEKDAVDDDGNPVYQGIDQSKLVPLLTAALQEAIGEIESLKARVAALESP